MEQNELLGWISSRLDKLFNAMIALIAIVGHFLFGGVDNGVATVETEPFTIVTNSIPTKETWEIVWDEVKSEEVIY